MNTKQIFYNKRKSESDYFRSICADAKSMENTTLFYYNNTISGLHKSPEERYSNEIEVLHYVFTVAFTTDRKYKNLKMKLLKQEKHSQMVKFQVLKPVTWFVQCYQMISELKNV